jgi:prolyl-tRNA synthetase
MRWSNALIPTLREDPAEAVARSHRLMVRAGFVRQVGAGTYTWLPLGTRVLNRIVAIVREEMDRSGAIEIHMPALWPQEMMEASGRLHVFGDDLIRFSDRQGRACVLAPTHEELVTALVRDEVRSYRQLPLTLYQIQTKFRDEPRPRFGVLRTREFLMKDAYSFSIDRAGLDESYELMRAAYCRIFGRCGLGYEIVEADTGAMGGAESHEFMVPAEIGGDTLVRCGGCGYSANLDRAEAPSPPPARPAGAPELTRVETPGQKTIEHVSAFLSVEPNDLVKTLLYVADGETVAALVRGDHDVNEAKLRRVLGVTSLELADAPTVEAASGAPVGFAGPVGLEGVRLIVDGWVAAMARCVTGANDADAHFAGVVPGRDFEPDTVADIRFVMDWDVCPRCGEPLELKPCIEVGHIFKLGTRYSEALGATCLDSQGEARPLIMGCYGIGIARIAAAAVESLSDEKGIVWPPAIAPYDVLVMPLDMTQDELTDAAERAYGDLGEAGFDVLLDDRPDRPGAKFKDAELIGVPLRVVVGRSYVQRGVFEVQVRSDDSRHDVEPAGLVAFVRDQTKGLRTGNG